MHCERDVQSLCTCLYVLVLCDYCIVCRTEPPQEQHKKPEERPEVADKGEGKKKGEERKIVKGAENEEGSGVSQFNIAIAMCCTRCGWHVPGTWSSKMTVLSRNSALP